MAEPVAHVEEGTVGGEFVAHGHVAMREDEEIDGHCGKQFSGELYLVLCFALELERALIVGVATGLRAESRECESLPGMPHTVQQVVETAVEHPFDEQVTTLFSTQSVTMTDETAVSVDHERLRLSINLRPEGLGEVVFRPHVVVACKIVDFNTLQLQVLQIGEQADVSFRHHIAILEPEVEDVT